MLAEAGWDRLRTAAPTHVRGVRQYLIEVLSRQEQAVMADAMTKVYDAVTATPPA